MTKANLSQVSVPLHAGRSSGIFSANRTMLAEAAGVGSVKAQSVQQASDRITQTAGGKQQNSLGTERVTQSRQKGQERFTSSNADIVCLVSDSDSNDDDRRLCDSYKGTCSNSKPTTSTATVVQQVPKPKSALDLRALAREREANERKRGLFSKAD